MPKPNKKESSEESTRKEEDEIDYSYKYSDGKYEYRHVTLPSKIASLLPKNRLLSETECLDFGIQQSYGWVHYAIHRPDPRVLLFRRPLAYQQINYNPSKKTRR